jgi:hypothetical protein
MNKKAALRILCFGALFCLGGMSLLLHSEIGPADQTFQKKVRRGDPGIREYEKILKAVKEDRDAVYVILNAVVSRGSNGALASSFPDICQSPPSPPSAPIPLPYPNFGLAKDTASGTKKTKIDAEKAEALRKDAAVKKSEGDEISVQVKQLEARVGKIIARRALNREEKRAFRKEWSDLILRAARLAQVLDRYVAETERLLKESQKNLRIRTPH